MGQLLHQTGFWARAAIVLLLLSALAPRILVPAGFMPDRSLQFTLTLCSEMGGGTMSVAIPMKDDDGQESAAINQAPCLFAGVADPMTPGAPAEILRTAIAYIVARGTAPVRIAATDTPDYLRPPLRGPPAA